MKLQKEVALYPDGSESISSQFTIDRTQIESKVGNGEVISKINQSPESVTIDAERININGVASFGNFATNTTLNSQINSVKAAAEGRQQVIYFAKASGQTATACKIWVTNTSGDNWVNVRPEYNSSKPVLWTAVQSQTINQKTGNTWSTTCECTDPVIDQTTTVIDGGRITTGTISAARIETGAMSIGYLTSEAQSAIKNDVFIKMDGSGIKLHPSGNVNDSLKISPSGMELFKGGSAAANSIASFGDSVRIGKTSGAYTTINSTSFNVIGTNQRKISIGFQSDSGKTVNIASYNSQDNTLISRFALADDYAYLAVSNSRFYLQSQNFSLISGNTTIFDGGMNQIHFRQSSTFHGALRTRFGTSDSNGEIGYMAYNNGSKSTAKDSWVDWSTVVNAGSRVMLTYSAKFTGRKGGRRGIRAISGTNAIDGSTIMVDAESTSKDIYLSGCVPIDTHINGTGFNLGIQTYQSSSASLNVQIWLRVIVVG